MLFNILSRKPQKTQSQRLKDVLSFLIGFLLQSMNRSVYFDDQIRLSAEKINDKGSNWHLPTKFVTQLPVPQLLPENILGWSGLAAKFTCYVTHFAFKFGRDFPAFVGH